MALSNYLADALLDHTLRNVAYTSPTTVYLALFSVATDANDSGTEVVGGSYARQAVTFNAAVDGTAISGGAVQFTDMPAVTVVGSGLYDASVGGNLLHFASFSLALELAAGSDFDVPLGDVVAVMR